MSDWKIGKGYILHKCFGNRWYLREVWEHHTTVKEKITRKEGWITYCTCKAIFPKEIENISKLFEFHDKLIKY